LTNDDYVESKKDDVNYYYPENTFEQPVGNTDPSIKNFPDEAMTTTETESSSWTDYK